MCVCFRVLVVRLDGVGVGCCWCLAVLVLGVRRASIEWIARHPMMKIVIMMLSKLRKHLGILLFFAATSGGMAWSVVDLVRCDIDYYFIVSGDRGSRKVAFVYIHCLCASLFLFLSLCVLACDTLVVLGRSLFSSC